MFARRGRQASPLSRARVDGLSAEQCRDLLIEIGPAAVIDCGRPLAEGASDADIEACQTAAGSLATAAREAGAQSVYVSCADVFSGTGDHPYAESDQPDPETAAGWAKFQSERAVLAANGDGTIVRTAWLFGQAGTNFAEYLLEAARVSRRVVVDDAVTSNPTYTGHLAEGIYELVQGRRRGIFHLAGSGACTRLEFARALFREAGLAASAVPPPEPGQPRRRRVLASTRPGAAALPSWETGVVAYLSALGESDGRSRCGIERESAA